MELLKDFIGQGLELAIHDDGVHLLVGSVNGLTHQQRETIHTNRERLLDELRLRTPMGQYHKAGDLPHPLLPEDAHFINEHPPTTEPIPSDMDSSDSDRSTGAEEREHWTKGGQCLVTRTTALTSLE